MEIILQICSVQEAELIRNIGLFLGPPKGFQSCLNLSSATCSFVFGDKGIPFLKVLLFAVVQVDCQLLIEFRHLFAQVPAAAVDHQIVGSVRGPVHFDEVISAAQRAKTPFQPFAVLFKIAGCIKKNAYFVSK